MGILERISTILRANIQDLLDRAENPEVMLDQYIRDLESAIAEAREELVNAMADEKRLAAKLDERQRQVDAWQQKAEHAVVLHRDEAARSALRAARAYKDEVSATSEAWQQHKERVTELQTQFEQLEKRLVAIKSDRDGLLAKRRSTVAKEKMTTAGQSAGKASAAIREIERMKERIAQDKARADAREEIAAMSADVVQAEKDMVDIEVEARLAELKAKLLANE